MNIENVEALKAALRADPDAYNQEHYFPTCNTACCLAGHAYLLKTNSTNDSAKAFCDLFARIHLHGAAVDLCAEAVEYLGIEDLTDAVVLLGTAEWWPEQFAFDAITNDATRHAAHVEKACNFLDYLAAGNHANAPRWYEEYTSFSTCSYMDERKAMLEDVVALKTAREGLKSFPVLE